MTVKAHQIYSPTLGRSLFVFPRTMPVTEIWFHSEADADILLVSDFLMNEYRPIVPWEPKCYKYLSYMSHDLILKDALFDEKRIPEKDLDQIKDHLGDPYNYLDEEITGSLLRVFLCDFWRVFFLQRSKDFCRIRRTSKELVGNCPVRAGCFKEVQAGSQPCCIEQVSDQHLSGRGVLLGLRGRFLRFMDTLGTAQSGNKQHSCEPCRCSNNGW